jgi:hypothetical protein
MRGEERASSIPDAMRFNHLTDGDREMLCNISKATTFTNLWLQGDLFNSRTDRERKREQPKPFLDGFRLWVATRDKDKTGRSGKLQKS